MQKPIFKLIIQIPTVLDIIDRVVPTGSNVAEPMLETLKSIECRRIELFLIERQTSNRRSTL